MNIAVNGKSFCVENKGGAVRVALNVLLNMAILQPDKKFNVFIPIDKAENIDSHFHGFPSNIKLHASVSRFYSTSLGRSIWEQFIFPFSILKDQKNEVILNLTNSASVLFPIKHRQILLLHDVGFLNPNWFSPLFSTYLTNLTLLAKNRHVKFVTVSQSTAYEIAEFLKIEPKEVCVILNAADEPPKSIPEIKMSNPYILFLGNLNPRKNISGAINGFLHYKQQYPSALKLVIIGAEKKIFLKKMPDVSSEPDIILKGYVDGAEKWSWVKGASLLILPSFLESFGLPILEALIVGTPVVASDLLPFRELFENAVEYVDPRSAESISFGIRRVIHDSICQENMIKIGYKVSEKFSWKKSALQYAELIKSII